MKLRRLLVYGFRMRGPRTAPPIPSFGQQCVPDVLDPAAKVSPNFQVLLHFFMFDFAPSTI